MAIVVLTKKEKKLLEKIDKLSCYSRKYQELEEKIAILEKKNEENEEIIRLFKEKEQKLADYESQEKERKAEESKETKDLLYDSYFGPIEEEDENAS